MKLSLIITAYKESKTVAGLIGQLEGQLKKITCKSEILLICPDKETGKSGLKASKSKLVDWIKDQGKGKPTALNKGFRIAKGEILILTDGDVKVGSRAIVHLLNGFHDPEVGAITARPVPLNSKNKLFGYWAHLLTEAGAHRTRLKRQAQEGFIDASGYLMAVRAGLVKQIPENSLSDDAVISRIVWNKGFRIHYEPKAKVYVKFPDNFKDWLIQKKRSVGGHLQLDKLVRIKNRQKMRSFGSETWGIWQALSYPKTFKEFWWTALLLLARLYLWLIIFWERKVINKPFEKTWLRVESTK